MRQKRPDDDLLAICGDDEHGTLDESIEDMWERHGCDDDPECLAVQQLLVPMRQVTITGLGQILDGRRPKERHVGQGDHRDRRDLLGDRCNEGLEVGCGHLVDDRPHDRGVMICGRVESRFQRGCHTPGTAVSGGEDENHS